MTAPWAHPVALDLTGHSGPGYAVAGGLELALWGDRMSAIEQFDLPFKQAMANEFKQGLQSLEKQTGSGVARFAKGAGRHGHFEKCTN